MEFQKEKNIFLRFQRIKNKIFPKIDNSLRREENYYFLFPK